MARKIKTQKSLLGIAREYGVSVEDLRRLNSAAAQKSGKIREVRIPSARLKGDKKEIATNKAREKRVKSGKATGSDFMKWIRGETDAGGRSKATTKTTAVKRKPVKASKSTDSGYTQPVPKRPKIKAEPMKSSFFKTCATCPTKGACRAAKKCAKKSRKKGMDPLRVANPKRGGN